MTLGPSSTPTKVLSRRQGTCLRAWEIRDIKNISKETGQISKNNENNKKSEFLLVEKVLMAGKNPEALDLNSKTNTNS